MAMSVMVRGAAALAMLGALAYLLPVPVTGARGPALMPAAATLSLTPALIGLAQPVFVTHAGDRSNRMFVVERQGTIRVVVNGEVLPTPFLDIRSIVNSSGLEQGLLGLAFHPRYATNGTFFVAYTASGSASGAGDNTVARYRVSSDPNRADPASARVLLAISDPAANHNGGMIAFGPRDGYLYVGTGDGGGGGDPSGNGQSLETLLGKILRLDVDGGEPYAVPPSNPFVGQANVVRREIWAYGLRNPWRFSFDRATGDLYSADVGQGAYEEVNFQPAGAGGQNYGWNRMEGLHCYPGGNACSRGGLTLPVAEYDHSLGCSVTGGYVYRGRSFPRLSGLYFYGDFCTGRIWSLSSASGSWVQTELLDTALNISSFGEDEAGEIYVADLSGGGIYRLSDPSAAVAAPNPSVAPPNPPVAPADPPVVPPNPPVAAPNPPVAPADPPVVPSGPPVEPPSAPVADPLALSTKSHVLGGARARRRGTVVSTIEVHNGVGAAVSGAKVTVELVHPDGQRVSKTRRTNGSGQVVLSFRVRGPGAYRARVVEIVLAGSFFDPGAQDGAGPVEVERGVRRR